jgi:hypothetical protein
MSVVGGGGGSTGTTAKRPAASETILTLALEFLAVGLFTLLAGANDQSGEIMILFMVGLWLIYLVTDSAVVAGIGATLTRVANGG